MSAEVKHFGQNQKLEITKSTDKPTGLINRFRGLATVTLAAFAIGAPACEKQSGEEMDTMETSADSGNENEALMPKAPVLDPINFEIDPATGKARISGSIELIEPLGIFPTLEIRKSGGEWTSIVPFELTPENGGGNFVFFVAEEGDYEIRAVTDMPDPQMEGPETSFTVGNTEVDETTGGMETGTDDESTTGDSEDETTGGMETGTDDESTTGDTEDETSTGEEVNEAPVFGQIQFATGEGEMENLSGVIETAANIPVTFSIPASDINEDNITVSMNFIENTNGATIDTTEQIVYEGNGLATFVVTPNILNGGSATLKIELTDPNGAEVEQEVTVQIQ